MRKSTIFILVIILACYTIGVIFYSQMPDRIAIHWNIHGEPDGFMPKFWGLFILPFILTFLVVIFMAIPLINPLKWDGRL